MTRLAHHEAARPPVTAPRVLLVDDDPLVLRAYQRTIARSCDVVAVCSAEAALETLSATQDAFAAIVTDQSMQGLPGTTLLMRARDLAPDALRVLLTGHAGHPAVLEAIARTDAHHVLEKPFPTADLVSLLPHHRAAPKKG